MLTELRGKAGTLCEPAKQGKLRCPLMIRSSSEDVITGHLFQILSAINPRGWLADFLNTALDTDRFHRQYHQKLRITPWINQPPYPQHFLPWKEGSTQVDCEISWNNPATTVFIEAKYQSDLSQNTSHNNGYGKYPADQLLRNIRVGLYRCGYFKENNFFQFEPKDFVVILLQPEGKHPLVESYRNNETLMKSIPHSDQLTGLPKWPFVGQITYLQIIDLLQTQRRWFTHSEQILTESLCEYLEFKRSTMIKTNGFYSIQNEIDWRNDPQPGNE